MPALPNLIVFDPPNFDPEDIPGSSAAYYAFDSMAGTLQPKQVQVQEILRPGHDNRSWRELGVWSPPSRIRTVLYVQTRLQALEAMEAYVSLAKATPYEIWQNGQEWGYFEIADVIQVQQPIPIGARSGSLIANPAFKHIVDFVLFSTDPPPEP